MSQMIGKHRVQILVACLAVGFLPAAAPAATINVILGNQDISYQGTAAANTGALFDTLGGYSGGTQVPGNADPITTATFELDNVSQGTLVSTNPPFLYGDLKIDGVGAVVPKGIFQPLVGNNGGGFGFDFFTSDGYLIELGIDKISLLIGDGIFFFFGTATVNLGTQNLPFNLEFTSPTVMFSYTATSVSVPPGIPGTPINMAMGSGAFTITGEGIAIPEPATTAVLSCSLAIVGLVMPRRRRRTC